MVIGALISKDVGRFYEGGDKMDERKGPTTRDVEVAKKEPGKGNVSPKGGVTRKHMPKLSGGVIAVEGVLITIFLSVSCPTILILPPYKQTTNVIILVSVLAVAFLTLWRKRYYFGKSAKWLYERLGGSKTYRE